MKIAIPASEQNLQSTINPRFGRCPFFLIFTDEKEEFATLDNSANQAFRGAGVSAAQLLANKGIEAVITANIGPNAQNALTSANIKIYLADAKQTIKEVLNQFKENKLKEI